MVENIKNLLATAASFLSSSQSPPGVTARQAEHLRSVNHMESKKFYAVMVSVVILSIFYFASVAVLFFIPHVPEIDTGFVTMFSKTTEILAIVIASYVGAQAAVDLKLGSNSNASLSDSAQTVDQNITQTITEDIHEEITVINSNAKEDDYEV